jgi:hypothetical protein
MPKVFVRGVGGTVYGGHQYTFGGQDWTEVRGRDGEEISFEDARELACHALGKAKVELGPDNYHEGEAHPAVPAVEPKPEPEPLTMKGRVEPEKKARKK